MRCHEVTSTGPWVCAGISLPGAATGLAGALICALVRTLICRARARSARISATARIASPGGAAIRSRAGTCSQCGIQTHGVRDNLASISRPMSEYLGAKSRASLHCLVILHYFGHLKHSSNPLISRNAEQPSSLLDIGLAHAQASETVAQLQVSRYVRKVAFKGSGTKTQLSFLGAFSWYGFLLGPRL